MKRCDICHFNPAEIVRTVMRSTVHLCGACGLLWAGIPERALDPDWKCPDYPPEA